MSLVLRIVLISLIVIYLVSIVVLLKKKKLNLKYALLWMLTGVVMLIVTVIPKTLSWFFEFCGIEVFTNGLFAMWIFFILLILLSITCIVSGLNEKVRRLTQQIALLEKRIRELEEDKQSKL